MCAKDHWANKSAQAKTLTFFGGKAYSSVSPLASTEFQAAQHHTLSALWSKARDCMLFQTQRDTVLLFHPSLNQCGQFPILIKSSVSAKLTSNAILSLEFQGFDDKLGILNLTDPNQC